MIEKNTYNSGQIAEEYTIDDDGRLNGTYISYYENGQLHIKCLFKDGAYNGPYEERYSNGKIRFIGTYVQGKLQDGRYTVYRDNGCPDHRFSIKDNKYNGPFEGFDKNGNLSTVTIFKNGVIINHFHQKVLARDLRHLYCGGKWITNPMERQRTD